MTDEKRISRRALLFGRGETPSPPVAPSAPALPRAPASGGFSLDAFYAKRAESGASGEALPVFRMREGLAAVETTNVGTPELGDNANARIARENAQVPAGMAPARAVPVAAPLRLLRDRCLAWQKSFCTVCAERCPEPGAIVLDGGRPILVDERCTRCGVCIAVCPAPVNAFELAVDPGGTPRSVA